MPPNPAEVISRGNATVWIEHPDGRVAIEEDPGGRRRVFVDPNPGEFVSRRECVTSYPLDLIRRIVEVKSPRWVCDEIARDEDTNYVAASLRLALLGYVSDDAFRGTRLLDFGSGAGASTALMARMFPETEIVGVELERDLIDIARLRAAHYGLSNLVFVQSPDSRGLPSGLGDFDYVVLSAVYEHLLPAERPRLCSLLWSLLKVRGVVFVNQLPYRFSPVEPHTTGLPLLNYLPSPLAHRAANRWSSRIEPGTAWPELLRNGVRGGTARSVRSDLVSAGGEALTLRPSRMGLRDHADLWYRCSTAARPHAMKRPMRRGLRVAARLMREPVAPSLSLAFMKLA